ncbi:1-deoxy-D-xylulose-5-phosphate synthase [Variovorax paradoxus]|uniref:1-deoxy-D-xylulose-5-phosphate synthase n=1 Tax=Variovorax paradoxus TaxID=34073 RepID=UPI0019342A2D|nr:1-deoxy-D-xylulose-5-phosphate synthase [Variovorax paradoxus]
MPPSDPSSSFPTPAQLRDLDPADLAAVATDLRRALLRSVSRTGGHLASNLGVVELTLALHHAFDTPRDALVWDVGHQCYAHKILTGRGPAMATLRKVGGLSGFAARDESPYDPFGAGHAGTAVSAAVGLAMGMRDDGRHAVAIVGDGALSAGMSFEALNHAGSFATLPLVVVLNDNGMSISPALGALHRHLRGLVERGPDHRSLFELLGLRYTGPIDGHDVEALVAALRAAKRSRAPQVIHVVTRKGRGYAPAEADPTTYHGPGPFDLAVGVVAKAASRPTFSQVFGEWVCDAAADDPAVVAITPAMREGSCLVDFERRFPSRFVDAAIAEQHAVTLAAGLAAAGLRPIVAIYSTFLQRGYDQLIHDVCLQKLPVLFAIDRAGIAGGDGATHLGAFDVAALRCIPNLLLMTPADGPECRRMLALGLGHDGPSAVRYPRAVVPADGGVRTDPPLAIGRGVVVRRSTKTKAARVALLVFGPLLHAAMEAAETLDATVANMRFVKPLDEDLLLELAATHELLVTLEEATVIGGAGAACAERLAMEGLPVRLLRLGLPDAFVGHGDRSELLTLQGLDAAGILASIRRFVEMH